jgi:hypothetical protein
MMLESPHRMALRASIKFDRTLSESGRGCRITGLNTVGLKRNKRPGVPHKAGGNGLGERLVVRRLRKHRFAELQKKGRCISRELQIFFLIVSLGRQLVCDRTRE